jgi:hypothetical protein
MARQILVDSTRAGGALVTLATTALNAIADGAAVEVDVANDTDRDVIADLELLISFGTAPTADKTIDVFWRRTIDGTNYEESSGSRPPANGGVGSFVLNNTTSAQRYILPGVMIPPKGGKLVIRSSAGQTASSSGNTLRALFYNPGIV